MSHPEIVENCKKIIIKYLFDVIGQDDIVSIILYGSVSRNEESYKNLDGKLYLESDLDVLVVVKNRTVVIKSWIGLKRLCDTVSDELRKKWLLSHVSISVTTENRLLHARSSMNLLFHDHLKFNGKVIFGKELIALMPSYEYKDISAALGPSKFIFNPMTKVVRTIASSGIIEGKKTIHGYNSVLKSIRKLTLFMIRAIIIKDGIPLNPWNLTEIKTKKSLYQIKNSIFEDLLKSYDDIKLSDSKEDCSMAEIERCLVRVINQFNSTIAILTGISYPFVTLPKKLVFGHFPFIPRLEYGIYIFLTNIRTRWTLGLFKFIIFTIFRPEDISLRFYDLFISSPNLINYEDEENAALNQQRQSWLKLYNKSLQRWKYDVVTI